MKKLLVIIFLIISCLTYSYAEEDRERINFDAKVRIFTLEALIPDELKLDYDLLTFDRNIDLKYLLGGKITFKMKGENFTGNKYNESLLLSVDYKYFSNDESDDRNDSRTLYYDTFEKLYVLLESVSNFFTFKFCPYTEIDGFGKCGFSPRVFIQIPELSDDVYSHMQYYLKDMNILNAKKNFTFNDEYTPIIAVIDDGIKMDNEDLEGNYWNNLNEIEGNGIDDDNNGYIDDVKGWNFINATGSVAPKGEHGTIVSSIIGAHSNNGIGISGITKSSKIMPIITCAREGCNIYKIIDSIKYAVDNGADIIYLNTGNIWFEYDERFSEAIKYANDAGVVIVTATGNGDELLTGTGVNTTEYKISPVCNEVEKYEIIGVSSMSVFSDKTKSGLDSRWSNYGDCSDVSAYGEGIVSLSLNSLDSSNTEEDIYRWGYNVNNGGSHSAAIITGIIGLGYNKYGKVSSKNILEALKYSKNKWHGIDTEKYLSKLGNLVEKENTSNKLSIEKENLILKNKYKVIFKSILGNRLDNLPITSLNKIIVRLNMLKKDKGIDNLRIIKLSALIEIVEELIDELI